ncbi:MAG: hypothetical protein V4598_07560 [Bdellovibrionota bacterium]
MKKILSLTLLLSTSAFANLHLAPPDFEVKWGRAVFVDIKEATYNMTFDVEAKVATVSSRIVFENKAEGLPVFDLIPTPFDVYMDGKKVKYSNTEDPYGQKMRLVNALTAPGTHVLELKNQLTSNTSFSQNGKSVSSAFWLRDLKYRKFLEQYIPTNYEYDQFPMTFNIEIKGNKKPEMDFYVNGNLTQTSPTTWKVAYPAYFTTSSLFFHMTPKGSKRRIEETYTSISGRKFPIITYTDWYLKTSDFMKYAKEVMAELEKDYGPWAHSSLIAYGTLPGGGMEHSGATQTSIGALDHEMLHSYFAKGVMPAKGDDGWLDEAIASWRDYGYQRLPSVSFTGSNIGRQSPYKRNTDDRSYEYGRAFLAYLDYRLQDMGGLKAFLRGYFAAYKHTIVTTEHFKNNLEFFSGLDLSADFDQYIWGKATTSTTIEAGRNPKHLPLTDAQLKNLL